MPDLLRKLDDEAILLMYLAGELSAEELAQVQQRLAVEPGLGESLDGLRNLQAAVDHAFIGGEVAASPFVEESSIRRTMREMRRRQLELQASPAPLPAPAQAEPLRRWLLSMPRWAYPIAAAAAIIFLLVGLWGFGVIDLPRNNGTIAGRNAGGLVDSESDSAEPMSPAAVRLQASFADASSTDALERADREVDALRDDSPFLAMK